MWPGSSPAWRKRQPGTNPRLGVKVKPPPSKSSSASSRPSVSSGSIFDLADPLLLTKRQSDDGTDDTGVDDGEAPPAAVTYNNGLWTPPAAASVASATPPAFTATVPLASASSVDDDSLTSAVGMTSAATAIDSITSLSPTSASASRTASHTSLPSTSSPSSATSSSSTTPTPSPTDKPHNTSPSGFKLVYLTPILVFVGLFLLFSVGGRLWGRYHHASRVEAARRAKYDRRASRLAKKREMQRIKTMWGYDRTPMLPPELEQGEHDLHYKDPSKTRPELVHKADSSFGSDSESGKSSELDEKYPGTFKILSLALLGEGSKGELPETRGEGGRKYEAGVQSNGWLAVKFRRWIGSDEQDLADVDDARYTVAPSKGRRLRQAFSRDRLRASEYEEKSPVSPTTTLSVGSGEMKHKAEFSSVELTHQQPYVTSPNRYTALGRFAAEDDPFSNDAGLGWKKPLPPQPKESPFRPAILNFGLRSRSKTYDPVGAQPTDQLDTPVKAAPYHTDESSLKAFGLGISGVWKTITNFTQLTAAPVATDDDEESFVGRPYRAHSDLMSDNDTPYSARALQQHSDMGTPTKQPLARTATVLQVKSSANQPWNTSHAHPSPAKKITTAAWNEALVSSPPNKSHHFQPIPAPPQPSASPAKHALAPRKSLLLHQAVTSAAAHAETQLSNAISPFSDYSELVACYSTPSDAMSPAEEGSIRALSPAAVEEPVGARQKLQRAKTTKIAQDQPGGVQRSKTGMNRKPTTRSKATDDLHSYALTQPLRVSKHPSPPIPSRASSSPSKQPSAFPTALRIASPDPIPNPISRHLIQHHHPHYVSPPKRASIPDEIGTPAKPHSRSTALQEVDAIVFNSYAQHR